MILPLALAVLSFVATDLDLNACLKRYLSDDPLDSEWARRVLISEGSRTVDVVLASFDDFPESRQGSLIRLLGEIGDPRALSLADTTFQKGRGFLGADALYAIAALAPTSQAIEVAHRALGSDLWFVRRRGVEVLCRLAPDRVEPLTSLTEDPDPTVRKSLLELLPLTRDPDATDAFVRVFESSGTEGRRYALEKLSHFDRADLLAFYDSARESTDDDLRSLIHAGRLRSSEGQAPLTLSEFGDLVTLAASTESLHRSIALRGLDSIRGSIPKRLLSLAEGSPDLRFDQSLLRLIPRIEGPRCLEFFTTLAKTSSDPETHEAIIETMATLVSDQTASAWETELFDEATPTIRSSILEHLSRFVTERGLRNSEATERLLKRGLSHKSGFTRVRCFKALCRLESGSEFDLLAETLAQETDTSTAKDMIRSFAQAYGSDRARDVLEELLTMIAQGTATSIPRRSIAALEGLLYVSLGDSTESLVKLLQKRFEGELLHRPEVWRPLLNVLARIGRPSSEEVVRALCDAFVEVENTAPLKFVLDRCETLSDTLIIPLAWKVLELDAPGSRSPALRSLCAKKDPRLLTSLVDLYPTLSSTERETLIRESIHYRGESAAEAWLAGFIEESPDDQTTALAIEVASRFGTSAFTERILQAAARGPSYEVRDIALEALAYLPASESIHDFLVQQAERVLAPGIEIDERERVWGRRAAALLSNRDPERGLPLLVPHLFLTPLGEWQTYLGRSLDGELRGARIVDSVVLEVLDRHPKQGAIVLADSLRELRESGEFWRLPQEAPRAVAESLGHHRAYAPIVDELLESILKMAPHETDADFQSLFFLAERKRLDEAWDVAETLYLACAERVRWNPPSRRLLVWLLGEDDPFDDRGHESILRVRATLCRAQSAADRIEEGRDDPAILLTALEHATRMAERDGSLLGEIAHVALHLGAPAPWCQALGARGLERAPHHADTLDTYATAAALAGDLDSARETRNHLNEVVLIGIMKDRGIYHLNAAVLEALRGELGPARREILTSRRLDPDLRKRATRLKTVSPLKQFPELWALLQQG